MPVFKSFHIVKDSHIDDSILKITVQVWIHEGLSLLSRECLQVNKKMFIVVSQLLQMSSSADQILQREDSHTAQLLRSGWTQAGRQLGYNAGLLIFYRNIYSSLQVSEVSLTIPVYLTHFELNFDNKNGILK
jgi:hypothetical protein